jgi:hypothetical protein
MNHRRFFRKVREAMARRHPNGAFTTGYAQRRTKGHQWRLDKGLVAALRELFAHKTILDLGAGIGRYAAALTDSGRQIHVHAYDGIPNIEQITSVPVKYADLTQSQDFPPVDWTLCLDVGEHIPAEFSGVFLDNVTQAREGVVISWGDPGCRGLGHVNNLPAQAVQEAFAERGFVRDPETEKTLRAASDLAHARFLYAFRRTADGD